MGECIISRAAMIPEEILNPITPIPGSCILNYKVVDSDNHPISGMPVTCVDGNYTYKYNTNEKGIVRFTTNSGQCNITFSNTLNNGVLVLDHATLISNMEEAPVGSVVNKTFSLNYVSSVDLKNSGKAIFLSTNFININLAGGGGGGGGAVNGMMWDGDGDWHYVYANGGAGGTGAGNKVNDISVAKNQIYNFAYGSAGRGGSYATADDRAVWAGGGTSGGTSYFGSYSAVGGGGGGAAYTVFEGWNDYPKAYGGSSGTSYIGGGYGGAAGTYFQSGPGFGASSGTNGGSGWLKITMRK